MDVLDALDSTGVYSVADVVVTAEAARAEVARVFWPNGPQVDRYVALLQSAYTAIKAVDPSVYPFYGAVRLAPPMPASRWPCSSASTRWRGSGSAPSRRSGSTSSASDCACIFCMTRARCTLMVFSVVFNS